MLFSLHDLVINGDKNIFIITKTRIYMRFGRCYYLKPINDGFGCWWPEEQLLKYFRPANEVEKILFGGKY
jgi:hypothetical protein